MISRDRLYQTFGELLYVIAMSDGVIQEKESEVLEEILKAHPKCTTKRDIFCLRVRNKQWILNTDIVKESIP